MATTVGSGKYTYEMVEDWAKVPEGWDAPMAAVAGDSQDRVYGYNRSTDHPVIVFDRDGNYLYEWGAGEFEMAHAILVDNQDNVWVVDRDRGQALKYTPKGELLQTIGTKGFRSDTGADPDDWSSEGYKQVTHGGDPFNLPAGIAIASSGDIFIADGYANARVHRFSSDGKHMLSWGGPGGETGEFRVPHGIWIDKKGRVLVADRENDRVQIFTQEGKHITTWSPEMIGPALFYIDNEDTVYIPEHNGGFISILNLDGERLARWGSETHMSCHGIWVDSHKDIYVVQPGNWSPRSRRVVKFVRK
jgi:DNA-binding beta-propeller fold protein YncE